MPKNKPKRNKGRGQRIGGGFDQLKLNDGGVTSQDDDTSETSSVVTACSEYLTDEGDLANSESQGDVNAIDEIEAKVKEAVDGLTEKNAKYRKECMLTIRKNFLRNWMADFLHSFLETLTDGLEKCLRKGGGEEQAIAADTICVVSLQFAGGESENLFLKFRQVLTVVITDTHSSVIARTKCCQALGILAFVCADDVNDLISCMSTFESVFRLSCLKGDKSVPAVGPAASDLHASALSAWAVLLSVSPWSKIYDIAQSVLPKLPELLTSSNVTLRITAGETIALFYEIMRSENSGFLLPRLLNVKELIVELKELATDSNKSRAKKDRRQQRSYFRDIVRAIESREPPEMNVKFGGETLYMDSWSARRQYNVFKEALATGISFHLKENQLLRDIFDLGPVLLDGKSNSRGSHFERHLYNQQVFKARSIQRGKMRDKRSAAMCS